MSSSDLPNRDLESPDHLHRPTDGNGTPVNRQHTSTAYRYLVAAAAFMVLGTSFLVYLGREEVRLRQKELAELDLQPLLYTEKSLEDQDRNGKVVVLYFWGFWNESSRGPYREFAQLQKDYLDNEDCLMVSVSCPQNDKDTIDQTAFYTKKFMDEARLDELPIYTDIYQFSRNQVSRLFSSGGFQYPTALVLNRDGKVEGVWRGSVRIQEVRASLETALATPATKK